MSIFRKVLIKSSGSRFVQRILEKNAQVSHYLMGIGPGGAVLSSGEQAVFRVLAQKCTPPFCVFDVGANKGQFLRLVLENLDPRTVSIHCFEPGREAFQCLAAASAGNARVTLNNVGIGKARGDAVLHADTGGSGLASLTKRRLDHFGMAFNETEAVAITTIDDYCAEHEIGRIHLLKLDIEGHELDALAGAQRMLRRKAIDIVTFEFGGCNIDTRTFFQDFWYLFSGLNMTLFRITPSGYCHPIASYAEFHEQFRTTNFMAVSNG